MLIWGLTATLSDWTRPPQEFTQQKELVRISYSALSVKNLTSLLSKARFKSSGAPSRTPPSILKNSGFRRVIFPISGNSICFGSVLQFSSTSYCLHCLLMKESQKKKPLSWKKTENLLFLEEFQTERTCLSNKQAAQVWATAGSEQVSTQLSEYASNSEIFHIKKKKRKLMSCSGYQCTQCVYS